MIIFGSRMYGRKNSVTGWGHCTNCGKYGKNTSYTGRRWGHLYFIPIIPEGPRVRVVKECKQCSQGMHIPAEEVPEILKNLCQSTRDAMGALIAGEETFDDNGAITPAEAYLSGAVEMLLCLQADDHLRMVISTLQESQQTHAYHLVNGEYLEFQGRLDEAAEAYKQAAECERQDPLALLLLGSIYMKKKDPPRAKDACEKALGLSDDKLPVLQMLLTIYTSLKDYSRLAKTYEECFALVPEWTRDKTIFKAYKKACKNAGRHPISESCERIRG